MKLASARTALIVAAIVAIGAFALFSIGDATAQQACMQPLAGNGTVNGTWDNTCLSENTPLGDTYYPTGTRYARFYTFTLSEATTVTVELKSSTDTYMYLMQGASKTGTILHYNDDIAPSENTNSRISQSLSTGKYTIEATTYEIETTGSFTLTISGSPAALTPTITPTPGDVLNRLTALETRATTQQRLLATMESKITALDSRIAALEGNSSIPTPTPTPTATPTSVGTPVNTATATPTPTLTSGSGFGESPDLAAKVARGELPPVEARISAQPMIIQTLQDGIGQYGGVVRRFYLGPADGCNFFRLSRASLVRFSQDGFSFIPSVARDWKVSNDGKEWTFFLRDDMKWSDGDDFNADDFVYQYEDVIMNEYLNPNPPFFLKVGNKVGSISKVDDTTIEFTFPVPNFLFLEIVAQADEACYGYGSSQNVPWAPSHYMKQFHPKYNPNANANAKAAGLEGWVQLYNHKTQYNLNMDKPTLAPWKLQNPIGSQVVKSERNPYFWAVDSVGNQLPYLDGIQMTLTGGGTEVGTLMAVQGDIDMQGRHIHLDQYTTLKQGEEQGGYKVLTWPGFGGSDVAFFFNMSLPGPTGEAIRTKEFRQALSLAIDREAIREIQFLGFGEIRQSVPSPGHPHYPGDHIAKLRTEYDPGTANWLLDSVFPHKDSEGWRTSNGERIVMSITVTDVFGTWPDAAQVVGRAWEAVGVKTDVNVTTRSLHLTRWQSNEWAVMVWNEDTTGFTFSSIAKRAPDGIGTFHGPGCAAWLIDRNSPVAFPCPQESIDLLEMHKRGPSLPDIERNALGKAIYKTIVENQYNIGIVGLSPMVQGIIVKKNTLTNVPDKAGNDWPLRTPNTGFPEQWYYSQ